MNPSESSMFESSLKEHSVYLFSLSYRLTGSYEDAQDLAQETFLKAWQKWEHRINRENPVPWLRKICINAFIDRRRRGETSVFEKKIVFPDMEQELVSTAPTPEDEVVADEEVRLVHSQCFSMITSTLPLYQRIVFVLNDIYQIGIRETSVLVDKSSAATKSLLHRARETMDDNFGPYCSVVSSNNSCTCRSWIVLAHDIQKRREVLDQLISSQMESKRRLNETRRRIITLFNHLPLHAPPPLWIDEVIRKIAQTEPLT
jgi:RNA polymerase sigma factor (sigma-70 family)